MYRIKTIENGTGEQRKQFMQEACRSSFGPRFEKSTASHAAKMEVWGSSFTDAGEDFCEFRLISEKGKVISTKRTTGF